MTTFRDRHELGLARRAIAALGDVPAGLGLPDLRAALGLPTRARKIRAAVDVLCDLEIVKIETRGPLRYRLVRKPAPGELRLEQKPKPKDVSVRVAELAVAELDERRQILVELRSRGGEQFVAARLYVRRSDQWAPTNKAVYVRPSEVALLAEAFELAAARVAFLEFDDGDRLKTTKGRATT